MIKVKLFSPPRILQRSQFLELKSWLGTGTGAVAGLPPGDVLSCLKGLALGPSREVHFVVTLQPSAFVSLGKVRTHDLCSKEVVEQILAPTSNFAGFVRFKVLSLLLAAEALSSHG